MWGRAGAAGGGGAGTGAFPGPHLMLREAWDLVWSLWLGAHGGGRGGTLACFMAFSTVHS